MTVNEREEFLKKAKAAVKKEFQRRDLSVMQAVRSIDDLDHAKNVLYNRVLEWFKLNFPEVDLANEEVLCKIVAVFGKKENLEYTTLADMAGEVKAAELIELAEKSFGAELTSEDSEALKELASGAYNLFATRNKIEKYVGSVAKTAFPNLSYLLDPLLAARLVTIAGGLERLAKMPGSTVQLLGAEKALFKYLRRPGSKPPKHGIIFQSPIVRNAKEGNRGKMARTLASKLALAARADFYSHNFIAEKLKQSIEKRERDVK
ncbi:MAG: hypothetical protein Q8R15_03010 [Candidatus Micrarchaeota archaeon]|nr:hypothetical protein [Candidatus Micrarchaeota archaeon]